MKIDNVLKKCDTFKSSFCLLLMFMTLALGTQAVSNCFLIVPQCTVFKFHVPKLEV